MLSDQYTSISESNLPRLYTRYQSKCFIQLPARTLSQGAV